MVLNIFLYLVLLEYILLALIVNQSDNSLRSLQWNSVIPPTEFMYKKQSVKPAVYEKSIFYKRMTLHTHLLVHAKYEL